MLPSAFHKLSPHIIRIPLSPRVQSGLLMFSRPVPVAALLEGATTGGRSIFSYIRDGFLGTQEVASREITTAVVWLWGQKALQKIYNKRLKPLLFKDASHLSMDTAWNWMFQKARSVDLTQQELHTKHAQEMAKLIRMKAVGWLFSVGSVLGLVAYAIPKATQLPTAWLIRHADQKNQTKTPRILPPHQPEGTPNSTQIANAAFAGSSVGMPLITPANTLQSAPQSNTILPPQSPKPPVVSPLLHHPVSIHPRAASAAFSGSLLQTQQDKNPLHPLASASKPASLRSSLPIERRPGIFADPNPKTTSLQFGNLMTDVAQTAGHLVDQTSLGSLLIGDLGILGGRAKAAQERDPSGFAAVEEVVRDGISAYIYVGAVPHLTKLLSIPFNEMFGSHLQIQPTLVSEINRNELMPALRDLEARPFNDEIKKVFWGNVDSPLWDTATQLKREFRSANPEHFFDLLRKEIGVYLPAHAETAHTNLKTLLEKEMGSNTKPVRVQNIQSLMESLSKAQGASLSTLKLTEQDRTNLITAIKQAFRHSAGLSVSIQEQTGARHVLLPALEAIQKTLPAEEQKALNERLLRVVQADNVNQMHTMFRRSLNLVRQSMNSNGSAQTLAELETHVGLLDKAASLHISLADLMKLELEEIRQGYIKLAVNNDIKIFKDVFDKLELMTPEEMKNKVIPQLRDVSTKPGKHQAFAKELLKRVEQFLPSVVETNAPKGALWELSARDLKKRLAHSMSNMEKAAQTHIDSATHALIKTYQEKVGALLTGQEGRLFSLALSETDLMLDLKIRQILQGGLCNDVSFLRSCQKMLGEFTPDSKLYHNLDALKTVRSTIGNYAKALIAYVEKNESGTVRKAIEDFYKLNRNLHFGTRLVALASAMFGLGIAVPKLQYAITKHFTGEDANPGLISAKKQIHQEQALHHKPSNQFSAAPKPFPLTHATPTPLMQTPQQPWMLPYSNPHQAVAPSA